MLAREPGRTPLLFTTRQLYERKADEADFRSLTSPGLPCYVYSHALRGERLAALNAHLSINCPQLALQTRPWQSFGNRSRVSCPTLLAALGHSSNGQATDTSTVTRRASDQDLSWYRVLGLEIALPQTRPMREHGRSDSQHKPTSRCSVHFKFPGQACDKWLTLKARLSLSMSAPHRASHQIHPATPGSPDPGPGARLPSSISKCTSSE